MSATSGSIDSEKMEKGAYDTEAQVVAVNTDSLALDTVDAANEYTPEQFRKLRWKTDLILLPILWAVYGLSTADKGSVSSQATFGLRTDTHLVGQQFSWLTTIFYLAFLVFELPMNWAMQRVHVGRTIGICAILWGLVVLCVAFAKNFTQLAALRFLQGAFESSIQPACLIITSSFYTTRELTLRVLIFGTGSASFGMISNLSLYGIAKYAQDHGQKSPWKNIAYLLGAFTIFFGVVALLCLGTAREVFWLSKEEKRMVAARTVSNQVGTDRQKRAEWNWAHARECLRDPQVYFLVITQMVNSCPNAGNLTFGNLVYTSFGFKPLDTLLKGSTPASAFQFIVFITLGVVTLKRPNSRFIVMICAIIPSIICFFLLAFLPNRPSMLWGKWTLYLFSNTGLISGLLLQTFAATNVAGRTKKTCVLSALFVSYCVGSSIGPQIYRSSDAPRYIHAIIATSCLYVLELTLMICWRTYYVFENRRRSKLQQEAGLSDEERKRLGAINAEMGMSDRENIHFKYDI